MRDKRIIKFNQLCIRFGTNAVIMSCFSDAERHYNFCV